LAHAGLDAGHAVGVHASDAQDQGCVEKLNKAEDAVVESGTTVGPPFTSHDTPCTQHALTMTLAELDRFVNLRIAAALDEHATTIRQHALWQEHERQLERLARGRVSSRTVVKPGMGRGVFPTPRTSDETSVGDVSVEDQRGKEWVGKELVGKELVGKELVGKEQRGKEQPGKEQPGKEQPAKEQPAKEQPAKEQPAKEQPAKEQPAKEQPAKEQPAKEQPQKVNKVVIPSIANRLVRDMVQKAANP